MTDAHEPTHAEQVRRQALMRAVSDTLDTIATPTLVIDLDAVEHNVAAMLRRAGNPSRWRPHIKTVKQPTLVGLLLDAGVHRFKAATPAEVQVVLEAAADRALPRPLEVLLAYPAAPPHLQAMLTLRRAHPDPAIGLLADSPEHLESLHQQLGSPDALPAFDLWLDVDLGMHRTGTAPDVWRQAPPRSSPWLRFVGLHGYDGHRQWSERAQAHAGYDALLALADALPDAPTQLCTSGTHSYAHALAYEGFAAEGRDHQVSPGTIVLSDRRSAEAAADLGLRQAAFVLSRVIARPGDDRITLDAGSKAIAPDCPPPGCAVLGEPRLRPLSPSEEHRPVQVESGERPPAGSVQWLVPDHVCTTVNLHAEALYVRTDAVTGTGPVKARGHRPWLVTSAIALAFESLASLGSLGCQPLTTEVDIQLLLPEDTTALERTNNVNVTLEPEGFSQTVSANGLDFALSFEVPPDTTIRTLSVYLAENDQLLAWGRTPPFRYGGATDGLGLLLPYAGALSAIGLPLAEPDPDALIASIPELGALVLHGDGTAVFLEAYAYQVQTAASLEAPPAADDGTMVSAADGGIVRVAWNDGVAAWRFDAVDNAWSALPLEGDQSPRPGAIAWVDPTSDALLLAGGGAALDVVSIPLSGIETRSVSTSTLQLDAPRPGAAVITSGDRVVFVGGDDDTLPLLWPADGSEGAGPIGDWVGLRCASVGSADPTAPLLCLGGQRGEDPTADALRVDPSPATLGAEVLTDLMPHPVSDPLLLADGEALFVQGDGHWFRIDPDLTVTQLPTSSPRASNGHTALLSSGATLMVGGLDRDGVPLDRFYAYAPMVEP